MSPYDRPWVGRALFASKGNLKTSLTNWWNPPPVVYDGRIPIPGPYFTRRLFLWMPRKMWLVDIPCPQCGTARSLTSKGIYNRVRLVLDVSDMYYLAAEYMSCSGCKQTHIAWDQRILDLLSPGVRERFPIVLTYKHACDKAVLTLLRSRTLGNSSSALQHNLQELHSDSWLRRVMNYMSDCEQHKRGVQALGLLAPVYTTPTPFPSFRQARWFLAVYIRDVWSRLPVLKAAVTSTFGSIL